MPEVRPPSIGRRVDGAARGQGDHVAEPVISVVIPCFNGERALPRLLESIFAGDFDRPFEVLVVDDGSTDRSLDVCSRYPVRVCRHQRNQGVSAARNTGARAARAPLLFFADVDVRLHTGTLRRIVAEFEADAAVDIVNCAVSNRRLRSGAIASYLAYKAGYDYWRLAKAGVRRIEISYIQTLAVALRRTVLELGGFDPRYTAPGGEEYEMGHRLSESRRLWLYPAIQVDHDTRSWHERLRVNFVRCGKWVPLFLRRGCRFESTTGVATGRRGLSSFLSTLAVAGFLGAGIQPLCGAFGLGALLAKTWLNWDFYRLLAGDCGLRVVAVGGVFELAYETSFGLGFVYGLARHGFRKLADFPGAAALFFRQFEFLFSGTPPHLVWAATALCNQRCGHCFYWGRLNRGGSELTLEEIRRVSAGLGHLKCVTLTGGEPSLRPDVVDCIEVFVRGNGLQQVGYHTNGMLPAVIFRHATELLRRCPDLVIALSVSLDGIEDGHDRIRGAPGAWRRALETIDRLKPLRAHRNFDLWVNTVYSAANADSVMELHRFVTEELGVNHAVSLIRGTTLDPELLRVDLAGYRQLAATLSSSPRRSRYRLAFARRALDDATRAQVLAIAASGRSDIPCTAGRKSVVLREDGELKACEMLDLSFGNVRDHGYDVPGMLRSQRGNEVLKQIARTHCCCTWECIQPSNLIFTAPGLVFLVRRWLTQVLRSTVPGPPGSHARR